MAIIGRTKIRHNNPIQTNGLGRHPSRVPSLRSDMDAMSPSIAEAARRLLRTEDTTLLVPHRLLNAANELSLEISDGIPTKELDELAADICAHKESIHPDYGRLASRIIISNHHKNTSPSFSEVVQSLWDFTDGNGKHSPIVAKYFYDLVMNNKENKAC